MTEYTTTVTIAASPDAVWTILTSAGEYREWNPEIVAIDGRMLLGARITPHVRLGDGAIRKVPQRVVRFEAPVCMEWLGGLPLGLFVGRRTFTLTPVAGGVEFKLHLRMSGLLAPLILKSVGNRQPEIELLSRALKQRAESMANTS